MFRQTHAPWLYNWGAFEHLCLEGAPFDRQVNDGVSSSLVSQLCHVTSFLFDNTFA